MTPVSSNLSVHYVVLSDMFDTARVFLGQKVLSFQYFITVSPCLYVALFDPFSVHGFPRSQGFKITLI
jgi:hypothetical protein